MRALCVGVSEQLALAFGDRGGQLGVDDLLTERNLDCGNEIILAVLGELLGRADYVDVQLHQQSALQPVVSGELICDLVVFLIIQLDLLSDRQSAATTLKGLLGNNRLGFNVYGLARRFVRDLHLGIDAIGVLEIHLSRRVKVELVFEFRHEALDILRHVSEILSVVRAVEEQLASFVIYAVVNRAFLFIVDVLRAAVSEIDHARDRAQKQHDSKHSGLDRDPLFAECPIIQSPFSFGFRHG